MSPCFWRLLCAAVCVAAAPVGVRAEEPAATKRVALVVFEKGSPDRRPVDAFLEALRRIDGRAGSISIVGGRELDNLLGRAQSEAAVACGADLRCVARIGEKAGASQVLFGRVTAQPDGVGMQWLLVGVRTAGIVGKLLVKVSDEGGAGAAAVQVARELLGVPEAELAEPPPVAAAPAGATQAPAAASKPEPARPSFWSSPRVIGGAAVAIGALTIGAAAWLGQRPQGAVRDAPRDPWRSALRASAATWDPGRSRDRRADLLLAAGGMLVAGGVGAFAYGSLTVAPVVSVDANAGIAGLSITW